MILAALPGLQAAAHYRPRYGVPLDGKEKVVCHDIGAYGVNCRKINAVAAVDTVKRRIGGVYSLRGGILVVTRHHHAEGRGYTAEIIDPGRDVLKIQLLLVTDKVCQMPADIWAEARALTHLKAVGKNGGINAAGVPRHEAAKHRAEKDHILLHRDDLGPACPFPNADPVAARRFCDPFVEVAFGRANATAGGLPGADLLFEAPIVIDLVKKGKHLVKRIVRERLTYGYAVFVFMHEGIDAAARKQLAIHVIAVRWGVHAVFKMLAILKCGKIGLCIGHIELCGGIPFACAPGQIGRSSQAVVFIPIAKHEVTKDLGTKPAADLVQGKHVVYMVAARQGRARRAAEYAGVLSLVPTHVIHADADTDRNFDLIHNAILLR